MAGQNKIFALSQSAFQRGTDYDIVMLYQVLLGRNPENSTVIQDHRSNTLDRALKTFLSSQEFRESVLEPIRAGQPVRRQDMVPRPSPDQLAWLFSRSILDEAQRTTLRQATNWDQFFQYLCSLDGFLEPLAAPPAPALGAIPLPAERPMRRTRPAALPPPEPPPPAGPSNADLMARLDRMEATLAATLADLLARLPPTQPPAAQIAQTAVVKPSSRRQAR